MNGWLVLYNHFTGNCAIFATENNDEKIKHLLEKSLTAKNMMFRSLQEIN